MIPSVEIVELDGALGVLPTGLRACAIVGPSGGGPLNTPAAFARTTDVISTFTDGLMVEAACTVIALTGKPVICVRSASSTVGTHTNIDVTKVTGTSVITVTPGDTNGNDEYEPWLKVTKGGTIGTLGIEIQWSLDGGRNPSAVTALGTANTFQFPGAGGIGYSFAAGTLITGDIATSRSTAPTSTGADITTALTALKNSGHNWEFACIATPLDGTSFDAVETVFATLPNNLWLGYFRVPTVGETEAAYKTAFDGAFGSKSTTRGSVAAGACELTSAGVNPGRKYLRSAGWRVFAALYAVSEEVDIAQPVLGSLSGTSIQDTNRNPKHHDETVNPGLDDSRATVLRTIKGRQGVFVNNARLLSASGSDFKYIQHRRVMILGRIALVEYFTDRLSREILVDKNTGYILREEREEINEGARSAMAALLMAKPKASAVDFDLSATDNLLSTDTLTGQGFITPLAYPKTISLGLGFRNPALRVQPV